MQFLIFISLIAGKVERIFLCFCNAVFLLWVYLLYLFVNLKLGLVHFISCVAYKGLYATLHYRLLPFQNFLLF